jgi:hypothetical protein
VEEEPWKTQGRTTDTHKKLLAGFLTLVLGEKLKDSSLM